METKTTKTQEAEGPSYSVRWEDTGRRPKRERMRTLVERIGPALYLELARSRAGSGACRTEFGPRA